MKIKSLINKMLVNWPVKIICFTLACLLFLFYQILSLDTKNIVLPLKIHNDSVMMPASSFSRQVRVSIRAKPEAIASIQETDFSAFMDLHSYAKPGSYTVPVQIAVSGNALLIDPLEITVEPKNVLLVLEEKKFRDIPIKPTFTGILEDGFVVGACSTSPATVKVSGPPSILDSYSEILSAPISLTGKTSSFTLFAPLENTNNLIKVHLREDVAFNISIVPKKIVRTFTDVPVVFTYLANNLVVSKQLTPLTLEISGPQKQLENYVIPSYAVQADCSEVDGDGLFQVSLNIFLPEGFILESTSPEKISISVAELYKKKELSDNAPKDDSAKKN